MVDAQISRLDDEQHFYLYPSPHFAEGSYGAIIEVDVEEDITNAFTKLLQEKAEKFPEFIISLVSTCQRQTKFCWLAKMLITPKV